MERFVVFTLFLVIGLILIKYDENISLFMVNFIKRTTNEALDIKPFSVKVMGIGLLVTGSLLLFII